MGYGQFAVTPAVYDDLVARIRRDGKRFTRIALEVGCCQKTVRRVYHHGVPRRGLPPIKDILNLPATPAPGARRIPILDVFTAASLLREAIDATDGSVTRVVVVREKFDVEAV